MSKYFFVSDIHSYASCLKTALKKAGFRKKDPDHILVVCGDIFDRGFETLEVYKYLRSLPKKRRVLIRGNHEALYLELLNKDLPERHDFSNGTVRTFCQIADVLEDDLNLLISKMTYCSIISSLEEYNKEEIDKLSKSAEDTWSAIKEKVIKSPITAWLKSDDWINYFELDDLICVHSFIPLKVREISETKWIRNNPPYVVSPKLLEVVNSWRTSATRQEWEDAAWGCPYEYFDAGLFNTELEANANKKLICGHWHVNDFHVNYNDSPDAKMNFNIYFGQNLIGLDACTARNQFCNVLVYDQNTHKYYDQFKKELV